jgi:hypothetical protein
MSSGRRALIIGQYYIFLCEFAYSEFLIVLDLIFKEITLPIAETPLSVRPALV